MKDGVWLEGSYIPWIDGEKRKWACPHIDKNCLLVSREEGLYEWFTEYDEPKLPYKYIFLQDIFPEVAEYKRPYIKCECPRDK